MSRITLSNTGDWKLEYDEQDVRGYRAVDKDGAPVGTVDAMIVDTEQELVDAIVLEDGAEYAARDISIGDGVVYLPSGGLGAEAGVEETVRVYGDSGTVVRRERVEDADYDAHLDAFRTHHASSYGDADGAFDDYDPAYRYGFDAAHTEANRSRAYVDAEDDLRAGYPSAHAGRDFDADRAAVRYGYTRAQHPAR